MSVHPFRPLPVVREPGPAVVEAAHCGWCRFGAAIGMCTHPVQGHPTSARYCSNVNPDGECPHFSPSWWTRLGRALRLWRAPALVDPRVWDRKDAP